ncbi:MAG: tyrosine-type recombinase/integrase [Chitinophagales bacterium]|nr:tyrosine-type recombinase/integrase [Chitinophagales bacterium]
MDLRNFLQYLQYEKRYSRHTVVAYENDLTQFSSYLKNIYDLDDILHAGHIHVRSWLVSLMESGIGTRTINRKLSSLKTFFKFEMKRGNAKQSPVSKVIAPKMSKRLPEFIHKNKIELFLHHYDFGTGFTAIRNRLIFEIFYATGIRLSELINLTDQSIDLYSSEIKVLGKGNKERIIPFTEPLKLILKEYLELRNTSISYDNFQALIVTEQGKQMSPRQVYSIIHLLLEGVTTIDKKSPHVLRHTFATHLLNNGAEINAIKELLGHASLAATQVYTHNSIDKLKDIYKKAHPKA